MPFAFALIVLSDIGTDPNLIGYGTASYHRGTGETIIFLVTSDADAAGT